MSKIIRTRKSSVLPYYAAALVFVVLCAVLPVYRLWALAAALAAAAAAFLAAKKVCPPRVVETEVPFHTGVEDVDAMLADIQQKLDTLHSLNESLPDPQLSLRLFFYCHFLIPYPNLISLTSTRKYARPGKLILNSLRPCSHRRF